MENIATQCKNYEQAWELKVHPELPFIIRLDGHRFSKFTKPFKILASESLTLPLNQDIKNAMLNATIDTVKEFQARTAYTASDEVTLVFASVENLALSTHIFKGRVQKLASLVAAFFSVRFNAHLGTDRAYFDARVFQFPTKEQVEQAVWWRYNGDTFRNGVSILASCHFSTENLHQKSIQDMIVMLKEKNIQLKDQDSHLLFGTFIKKVKYNKEFVHPQTGQTEIVTRSQVLAQTGEFYKELSANERLDYLIH